LAKTRFTPPPRLAPQTPIAIAQTLVGRMYSTLTPEEIQALLDKLIQTRLALVMAMGRGVQVVDTPGVGRVEYASAADMQAALDALEREISILLGLLGADPPRRRPIHMVAIE